MANETNTAKANFIYSKASDAQRMAGGGITVKCGPSVKNPGSWVTMVYFPAGIQNFPEVYRRNTKQDAVQVAEEVTKRYSLVRAEWSPAA
jgi:hypothetical protein